MPLRKVGKYGPKKLRIRTLFTQCAVISDYNRIFQIFAVRMDFCLKSRDILEVKDLQGCFRTGWYQGKSIQFGFLVSLEAQEKRVTL